MTLITFPRDAFFGASLSTFFDRRVSLAFSPLPPPKLADSFESNHFEAQFHKQVMQLREMRGHVTQQFSGLKNNPAGAKRKQELMAEYSLLERRHKMLALIAEHLEKSSQTIVANFR